MVKSSELLIAICAFIFICACGFFIGWIGGVKPFTYNAGWFSLMTVLIGLLTAAGGVEFERDHK